LKVAYTCKVNKGDDGNHETPVIKDELFLGIMKNLVYKNQEEEIIKPD